jgi:hypothetical protein
LSSLKINMACDEEAATTDWYYVFECQGTGFRSRYIDKALKHQREMGVGPRPIKVFRVPCGSKKGGSKERCVACVQPQSCPPSKQVKSRRDDQRR